jgi:two-component system, OmpR family, sensor kinase
MKVSLFNRLYVRIWLAVIVMVLLLTLLFGWLWRENADRQRAERAAEQPLREMVVRDARGEIIAKSSTRPGGGGRGLDFELVMPDGTQWFAQVPPPPRAQGGSAALPRWMESNVQRNPGFMFLLWGVLAVAVGLGSYPVVRRLTQRLESLQRGVERWGTGDLRARVNEDGADEVAFLGQRFNAAADRIEALVLSHKSLLANASHELRSPLARIRMGIELMSQTPSTASASAAFPSTALKTELARNISELDALIDEILLSSRLDAAQHSGNVDVGSVETVDMVALVAEECARLQVALDVPQDGRASSLQIRGVPRLLRRMVRNLLENAKRYGGSDVQAMVCASSAPGVVEIHVSDSGPGVPVAERERIFEPFYRSSLASESGGGVGLGLSLVRSIAQTHGGSVVCLGRDGPGASFVVRLAGKSGVN